MGYEGEREELGKRREEKGKKKWREKMKLTRQTWNGKP